MQALNVQFLTPQTVSTEKPETALKPTKASDSSFKAMLEKASASKKSEQKKQYAASLAKEDAAAAEQCAAAEKSPEPESKEETAAEFAARNPEKERADGENRAEIAASRTESDGAAVEMQPVELSGSMDAALAALNVPQPAAEPLPAETVSVADGAELAVQDSAAVAVQASSSAVQFAAAQNAVPEQAAPSAGEDDAALLAAVDAGSVPEETPAEAAPVLAAVDAKAAGKNARPASAKENAGAGGKVPAAAASDAAPESRQVFTIIDQRGKDAKLASLQEDSSDLLVAEAARQNGSNIDLTLNLANTAQQDILSANNQAAGASGSTFQEMLSNQIQQQAPEFVKAGNIILKDGNSGTINMNLKPESLGNVKISLQLTDKGIEGQITVASKEAFEAFKQNLDTLKQAFHQSGFDTASFNLNLASNADGGQFQQGQQAGGQFFANKTFGSFAQEAEGSSGSHSAGSHAAVGAYSGGSDHHIDVVA
ncbi:MAG: flagellar hook-length control protein FliK [Treponema sp.]|nr:flagellar hook-length control protein FliK [Treponema sp.]